MYKNDFLFEKYFLCIKENVREFDTAYEASHTNQSQ